MKKRHLVSIVALTLSSSVFNLATAGPSINLIPVTAIESIKQSTSTAKSMENRLSEVITKIENNKKLFDSSKCEGAIADKGCDQLRDSMSESYKAFLEVLSEELPSLGKQLSVTAKSIEKQLKKELGKGMTPLDIQRLVAGRTSQGKKPLRARTSNNSHAMVAMLENISSAVSTGGHGDVPAVVASDIYVNMRVAAEQIEGLQMDINQSLATIDTYSAFGQLSESQLDTVASVKAMIFGDVDGSSLPAPIEESEEEERSPWERRL